VGARSDERWFIATQQAIPNYPRQTPWRRRFKIKKSLAFKHLAKVREKTLELRSQLRLSP
jgi:hypothetical protein